MSGPWSVHSVVCRYAATSVDILRCSCTWNIYLRRICHSGIKTNRVTNFTEVTENRAMWKAIFCRLKITTSASRVRRTAAVWGRRRTCCTTFATYWRRDCVVTPSYVCRLTRINSRWLNGWSLRQSSTASVSSSSASSSSSAPLCSSSWPCRESTDSVCLLL